jgi:hypothetical protein
VPDDKKEQPEKGDSSQAASLARKVAPYLCLAAAVVLVSVQSPPDKLVDFIGSDFWARLALGLLVFLCLYGLLLALGIATGSVSFPGGAGIGSAQGADSAALVEVGSKTWGPALIGRRDALPPR